jgi:hypothetical protein
MKNKTVVLRIAGVVAVTTVITVFVHAYGIMQANWLQYGLKIGMANLPVPTMIYYHYSFLGYILPIAASLAFLIGKYEGENKLPCIDVFLLIIAIIALAWLLASMLAWQLPLYYPVSVIR